MAKLPMIEEVSVQTRGLPTIYQDPSTASPRAFGAELGAAITQTAEEQLRAYRQRKAEDANFASADTELKFGIDMDAAKDQYDADLKKLRNSTAGDYGSVVEDLKSKYTKKIEDLRVKYSKSLSDPAALKAFSIRTRLQTQGAYRHLSDAGEASVVEWKKQVADAAMSDGERRGSAVSGKVVDDVSNFQLQVAMGVKPMQDFLRSQGVAEVEIDNETKKYEARVAKAAIEGYGTTYKAAVEFLASTLPSGVRIGFDPSNPKAESILDAGETQAILDKLEKFKVEKVGADLGERLFQQRNDKGFNLEKRLEDASKEGVSGEEIGKARQHFMSAYRDAESRRQIAEGYAFDGMLNAISKDHGGDVDAMLRSKDEATKRRWSELPVRLQLNVRNALAKEQKLDPETYRPYGEVLDASATPGGLTARFPTFESFRAQYQGVLGPLWPQAVDLYKGDALRRNDPSQNVHYAEYRKAIEEKAKVLVNWQPEWIGWSEAGPAGVNMRIWMAAAAEQAWADHEAARKTAKGERADATWWVETANDIANKAEALFNKGAFESKKPTPAIPSVPAAKRMQIGYKAGDRVRGSELPGGDPNRYYVYDGKNFNVEK